MPKGVKQIGAARTKSQPDSVKGWQQIAAFLGQPVSVAQRWSKTGMPVTRQGRSVVAFPTELTAWLAREAGGEPVRVVTEEGDLSAQLRQGLSYVRRERREPPRLK